MAKKNKVVEVEEVQAVVEEPATVNDAVASFIDKKMGVLPGSDPVEVVSEEVNDSEEQKFGIPESLDLSNFSSLVDENVPGADNKPVEASGSEFQSMDEDKKQEYAQNDPDVSVDISQLKDNNKKSIYDLISQRDSARTQSKSLEKKMLELEKALASRPTESKVEEFQGKVDELTNRLGYYEVSETPAFLKEVQNPRNEIKETLYYLAQEHGIETSEVDRAIGMSAKERTNFLRDNYPDFLATTGHHLSVLDRLFIKERRLREDHPKIMDEHRRTVELERERATAVGKKQQSDKLAYMYDIAVKSAQDNHVPFFIKKGEEDHDVVVDDVVGKSQEIIMSNDPDQILRYAVIGASVPAYHKELYKYMARVKELEGKIGRMSKASPGSSGKSSSEETTSKKVNTFDSFLDEVAA